MATTTPTTWTEDTVATELLGCEAERRDRTRFTDEWPELDVATGYRIQHETCAADSHEGSESSASSSA